MPIGVYLGYSKSPKFRVWVDCLDSTSLGSIEDGSHNHDDLAKKLFISIFKERLENDPENKIICITESKSDGRELLSQKILSGIRCELLSLLK